MRKLKRFLEISVFNNNDPFLEAPTPPLTQKQLPDSFPRHMELLKITASHHNLVSLSSNQVRMPHRVFAILKQPLIQPGVWKGYEYRPDDYELIANPQRTGELGVRFKDFEECPSIPGMRMAVWNPIRQTYKFQRIQLQNQNISLHPQERTLQGFIARIWDHQVRHLNGILTIGQDISHGQVYVIDEYRDNPGVHQMVQLTKSQLKLMGKESLKKFRKKGKDKTAQNGNLSVDQIPQKITKEMQKNLQKQYNAMRGKIEKQKSLEETEAK